MSGGPLTGLRVVEMAGIGPCPFAGQLLADMGADVLVIDRKSAEKAPRDVNRRGKRSAALNLKTAEGAAAALRLIAGADILIEGFRPGVMERLGLGPAEARAANPRLIYGRMTGWGQTGPLAQSAGHDLNYIALTGVLGAMGHADRPPTPPLNFVGDYAAGTMFLIFGVLSALWERSRSGEGQVVDAAMVDATPLMAGLMQTMTAAGQWSEAREANLLDGGAPFYRVYEAKDGGHVALGALEPQFFAAFATGAGIDPAEAPERTDPRTWPARREDYAALFASRTRDEWAAAYDGTDACVAPVLSWSEAREHPHLKAREVFYEEDGVHQTAPAPRFDRTPPPRPAPPRAPGADTEAALSEAGFDDAGIEALRAAGALG